MNIPLFRTKEKSGEKRELALIMQTNGPEYMIRDNKTKQSPAVFCVCSRAEPAATGRPLPSSSIQTEIGKN